MAGWTDEKITKYPRSVAVTWQTSVDQVGDPARRLLERLAWFAPEPVPDFMLDVPLPGVAAEDLDEALADLSSYSLVRRHPGRQEFSVHRLVQDVTRRSLGGEAAHAALTDALTWLDDGFSADDGDLAVRADMERLASHVRFAVERGDDCGISIPTAALAARLADLLQDRVPLHDIEPLYRRAFAIFDRLAKADPGNAGWQRDLSVSYERVGDVLVAQGNLPEALKAFRDCLAIRDRLAKADPGNAGWQRDLSVSYERVGDVLVAQGNLPEALKAFRDGLAISDRLAKADPGNAGWQRDLSVSYNKVGDVLVAQGNLPEALKAFRDCLAICDRLAKADPGNAGWQRDLSVSYNKVGDVLVAQGNLPEALKAFRDGLAICDRLAKADPATPDGSATCRYHTTRSATCWWPRAICPRRSKRSATPSPSETGSPRPTPETPDGSATCRYHTTRSATCWWPRAICPRR